MKILAIIFIFVAFTLAKGQYLNEASGTPVVAFPTLAVPDFEFQDLSGGCGDFVDCIEFLGYVVYNIGLGIIFLVLLLVNLIVYIFEILALIVSVQFTGVEGAPSWVNVLMTVPFLGAIALVVYKLVRKGDSTA